MYAGIMTKTKQVTGNQSLKPGITAGQEAKPTGTKEGIKNYKVENLNKADENPET